MHRKGTRVYDIPTRRMATIIGVSERRDVQPRQAYYELDESVPTSPNYPTRWRHSREITLGKPAD